MSKQTDVKGQHNFIQFYFVYMWRTPPPFLDPNSVPVTLFSSENSLFIHLWNKTTFPSLFSKIEFLLQNHTVPL